MEKMGVALVKFDIYDVFTPSSPAVLSFVERQSINEALVDSIRTPGKQIVIYGYSGSGKTTLIINKLDQTYENYIISRAMIGMTVEHLILDAFDQLDVFYTDEKQIELMKGKTKKFGIEYSKIKASIETNKNMTSQEKGKKIVPPQLTAQNLFKFIGNSKCCWVIEDFHKIRDNEEKTKFSQIMKICMDMSHEYKKLKIICIGTMGTAREIIEYDQELKNRVAEICVPLMSDEEIKTIIKIGEKRLNIIFDPNVKEDIKKYSSGLASVCHQLALNSCIEIGLVETIQEKATITENEFKMALEKYVEHESDTTKSIFDKALRQERHQKYENFRLILYAIAKDRTGEGVTRAQILKEIKKYAPSYPQGNLTRYLGQLSSDKKGEIIRFNVGSGKFLATNIT